VIAKSPILVLVLALALAMVALLSLPHAGATAPATNGRIAFSRYVVAHDPYFTELWVVNVDGTGSEKITHVRANYMDQQPDWSPDGKRIVFARCPQEPDLPKEHCRVYTVKSDGGGLTPIGPGCTPGGCGEDRDPAWSPDGTTIAFIREWGAVRNGQIEHSEIFLMSTDGSDVRRLTHLTARKPFSRAVRGAAWSPDGQRLVFALHNSDSTRPADGRALFVVGARGDGLHRLTPWSLRAGDHPDWSPDGSRILFTAVRTEDALSDLDWSRDGDLYTVRADGAGPRRLTDLGAYVSSVQSGSFSPDGRSIVFATSAGAVGDRGPDVYVMAADGTNIRPVTRTANWEGSPDWGPK
jgi:TolB protein